MMRSRVSFATGWTSSSVGPAALDGPVTALLHGGIPGALGVVRGSQDILTHAAAVRRSPVWRVQLALADALGGAHEGVDERLGRVARGARPRASRCAASTSGTNLIPGHG